MYFVSIDIRRSCPPSKDMVGVDDEGEGLPATLAGASGRSKAADRHTPPLERQLSASVSHMR
jgi:hypothetical protein